MKIKIVRDVDVGEGWTADVIVEDILYVDGVGHIVLHRSAYCEELWVVTHLESGCSFGKPSESREEVLNRSLLCVLAYDMSDVIKRAKIYLLMRGLKYPINSLRETD